MISKLKCFSEKEWNEYIKYIPKDKGVRKFDICSDCTVDYQRRMCQQNTCEFPEKRVETLSEYS